MPYANGVESNQYAILTAETDDKLYRDLRKIHSEPIPIDRQVEITHYHLVKEADQPYSQVFAQIELDHQIYYTKASNLRLILTNPINQEIERLSFPKASVTNDYQGIFPKWEFQGGKPTGVLVHDTGNERSTIDSEVAYMNRNFSSSGVFVHTFINHNEIRQIADPEFMAQGAGGVANPRFIQFELTREKTREDFTLQVATAAYYTALTLRRLELPLSIGQADGSGTLWTHEMVSNYLGGTDHIDPRDYWASRAEEYYKTTYGINNFKEIVQVYYNTLTP
ncbi:putative autolysin [Streptococcus sp. DD10]|uniref:peptidoglycan recognition protein family protein n=1 Tax=Streptococcus sp. DD10 TaxID=1777878 RepID=UPI00079AFF08|nr:peptidoglycan recognition family protein [Streptococcus sp. DD10]KXT73431.1 putative autolysin [Streptococcus sp. DD10]